MKEIIEDLAKLGKEISAAKSSLSRLQGRGEVLFGRLEKESGTRVLMEAEEKLEQTKKEKDELGNRIREKYDNLKGSYSW